MDGTERTNLAHRGGERLRRAVDHGLGQGQGLEDDHAAWLKIKDSAFLLWQIALRLIRRLLSRTVVAWRELPQYDYSNRCSAP